MGKPKKLLNNPANVVTELLDGLVAASGGELLRLGDRNAVVRDKIADDKVALLIGGGLLAAIALSRAGVRYFWAPQNRPSPALRVAEVLPVATLLMLIGAMVWQADAVLRYTQITARQLHQPSGYIGHVVSTTPKPSPQATGQGGLRR